MYELLGIIILWCIILAILRGWTKFLLWKDRRDVSEGGCVSGLVSMAIWAVLGLFTIRTAGLACVVTADAVDMPVVSMMAGLLVWLVVIGILSWIAGEFVLRD